MWGASLIYLQVYDKPFHMEDAVRLKKKQNLVALALTEDKFNALRAALLEVPEISGVGIGTHKELYLLLRREDAANPEAEVLVASRKALIVINTPLKEASAEVGELKRNIRAVLRNIPYRIDYE